jgi:hypothetical protein
MSEHRALSSRRFKRFSPLVAMVAVAGGFLGMGTGAPASAISTTPVDGSAYGGYTNISIFGGPYNFNLPGPHGPSNLPYGPSAKVVLRPGGSSTPLTGAVARFQAQYGPATILETGPQSTSTQGTPGGTVTSTATVNGCATTDPSGNGCTAGQIYAGPVTADSVSATSSASASGTSGSSTWTNGVIVTDDGDCPCLTSIPPGTGTHPPVTQAIPVNPPPNYTVTGVIRAVGGSFKWVFNEQFTNPDGSITVNAGHEYPGQGGGGGGPAKGDAILAHVTSGVSGVPTQPTCTVTAVHPGPPKSMDVTIQDSTAFGLDPIANPVIENGTISEPQFVVQGNGTPFPGITTPVVITATKSDQSRGTAWSFDMVEHTTGNVVRCN